MSPKGNLPQRPHAFLEVSFCFSQMSNLCLFVIVLLSVIAPTGASDVVPLMDTALNAVLPSLSNLGNSSFRSQCIIKL